MENKETIEKASEYYAHNYFDMHETNNYKALKQGFEAGVKWQQERMYSEEDLKEAFKVNYTPFSATNIGDFDKDWNKWFEQFKNK